MIICARGFGMVMSVDCWLFCNIVYLAFLFVGLDLRLYILLLAMSGVAFLLSVVVAGFWVSVDLFFIHLFYGVDVVYC